MRVESQKNWYKKHIKMFLTTWNQLRVSLDTNGKQLFPCRNPLAAMDVWLEATCFDIQVRLRSRPSTVKRTWTSRVTSWCSYLAVEVRVCAPRRSSATSSLCTMTWCTVWRNTLERRPGGGAHVLFFRTAPTADYCPAAHSTVNYTITFLWPFLSCRRLKCTSVQTTAKLHTLIILLYLCNNVCV